MSERVGEEADYPEGERRAGRKGMNIHQPIGNAASANRVKRRSGMIRQKHDEKKWEGKRLPGKGGEKGRSETSEGSPTNRNYGSWRRREIL